MSRNIGKFRKFPKENRDGSTKYVHAATPAGRKVREARTREEIPSRESEELVISAHATKIAPGMG